jgi:hypothetical protein
MAKFGFQPIHFSALGIDKNKALRTHRFELRNDLLNSHWAQFERFGKDDHPKGLMLTKHSQLVLAKFFRTATDDDWFHLMCLPNLLAKARRRALKANPWATNFRTNAA